MYPLIVIDHVYDFLRPLSAEHIVDRLHVCFVINPMSITGAIKMKKKEKELKVALAL